ncbi:MAG: NUDIX hydrolase [Candidatus Marinimicrobia bacterium]|nr:NUDIX hydrolase [Candidatus Neomarinimicrobiota bacterium]
MSNHSSHIVAVVAILQNLDNRILLIHDSKRGWELPGGKVEEGEDLIQALHRELFEETGARGENFKLFSIYSRIDIPSVVLHCFRGQYLSGKLQGETASNSVEWVDVAQAVKLISHPAIHHAVEDYQKNEPGITYCSYVGEPFNIHARYVL